jgi:soluble lytic murein transglycosylase-like protein
MASLVNASLPQMIYDQALAQGVQPSIALAVAQQESGISQWQANGNLVTGSSGEIGVFQIMPGTAAGMGIDPSDVEQNISGGISYLAQLYQKYGNWPAALSAYNSGSPTGSPGYANSVLAIAGGIPDDSGDDSSSLIGDTSGGLVDYSFAIVCGLLAVVGLVWWMD